MRIEAAASGAESHQISRSARQPVCAFNSPQAQLCRMCDDGSDQERGVPNGDIIPPVYHSLTLPRMRTRSAS